MSGRRRRATLHITLFLVGLVMAGCGERQQRHVYKNKKDCLDDWGGNEQDCQEPPQGSSHYGRGYYYGPRYSGPLSGSRGARALSSITVSRGGFGSLAGFHSSFGG